MFSPATNAWFEASFAGPTQAQELGWPAIASGAHTLIHAPTGSGKTLAAFLHAIDGLLAEETPPELERCRVLYVSPMKALAYDVERNLRAPLVGIRHAAERSGLGELPEVRALLRTGDTPQDDRRRMLRHPPDILITTPESLYLMLTSQARGFLSTVRTVIIDEVHAVAGTKRGAHLAVSLERLEEITENSPQRIGLSATQRPLTTTARFMGGGTVDGEDWTPRPVEIIDASGASPLDLDIEVPVPDMTAPQEHITDADGDPARSIWPAVYPRLLDLIKSHTSTIVFANSRRLAERISGEINNLAGEEVTRAHHGSVARDQRVDIEEQLKQGELAAVVATSSLELGIDMGAVDLVVQVEAPPTVASGLQRVGRAGHQVGATSVARMFPKYRGDLLVATVTAQRMREGLVEPTSIPRNPLDVLSQQIVASIADEDRTVDELFELVRRAAPYAELTRPAFEGVLDMLAGRYPSDLFSELRPRVTWDRVDNTVSARPGAKQLAVQNPGTIPDRGLFSVHLPEGGRVGELDEEMVYESRPGDVFVLGTSTWKILEITPDRVEVVPAPATPGARMPFWHGDLLGRPLETGRAIGAFTRELAGLEASKAIEKLETEFNLDQWAAENLVAYFSEEREAAGILPTDQTIVVQRFRDEIGDWRLVILSPFGARVHAPWAMALTRRFQYEQGRDVDVIWADDGMAFRFVDAGEPPAVSDVILDPDEVEGLLLEHLIDTSLFAARFREASARALLLPRRRPGRRTPLWLQRRRSADLLAVAKEFGSFPIVLETYREVLQDDFDLPSLQELLRGIRARKLRIAEADVTGPSPFAQSLLFAFVAAYLYEADTPLAERRAAALSLDRELLRELLGEGELRELLSAEVIDAVERELQRFERPAKSVDSLHDMLRYLGPLSAADIGARFNGNHVAAIEHLLTARRIIEVVVGGQPVLAAIEDAGRLRDALGVQPPPGIPQIYLETVDDPLGDVIGRYARTHGPFSVEEAATSLHLPVAVVEMTLDRLEANGRVVRGAFRPAGAGSEWVGREVLRRLKRRSLAELRAEIEPADRASLGRFLPGWHGIGRQRSGAGAIGEVVRSLQGAAIPASILERDVLVSRMEYQPSDLDQLMATGDLVWVGIEPIGSSDGRVALYDRAHFGALHRARGEIPEGPVHDALLGHLSTRGASFFRELYDAAGGGDPDILLDALWDLVWAGAVTNDTIAPLRAFLLGRARTARRRPVMSTSFPPSSAGRWSLVADIGAPANDTTYATSWVDQLLERHGLVTRDTVSGEGIPGGFTALYPVLREMEQTGRVRRGYFVEGLGGAQFAKPGAVDRLRSEVDGSVVTLAAADPANPYGSVVSWPETPFRVSRSAGAYVVLVDGEPGLFLERGGRSAVLFDVEPSALGPIATELARIGSRRRKLTIESVNGEPINQSPLREALIAGGFAPAVRGLAYRSNARG